MKFRNGDFRMSRGLTTFTIGVCIAKAGGVIPFAAMPWWIVVAPGLAMPFFLLVILLVSMCGVALGFINRVARRRGREIASAWRRRSVLSMNWMSFR